MRKKRTPHQFRELKALIWAKTDGLCYYCGTALLIRAECRDDKPMAMHMDHLVPLHRDGSELPDNLVPSCRLCNFMKGAEDLEVLRWRRRLLAAKAPVFTPAQRQWLLSHGVDLDRLLPPHCFWFEENQEGMAIPRQLHAG